MSSRLDPAAFAELLAGYCLDVRPGQQVLVRSTSLAAPLLLELQRAMLERDAWPVFRVELPGQAEGFYASARDRHLDDFPSLALREAKECDATVGIQAPENTRALAGVDPALIARMSRGRREVREQMLKKRWCSTLWPTEALAQQAGLSLADFSVFVARALFLDRDDPVASWRNLGACGSVTVVTQQLTSESDTGPPAKESGMVTTAPSVTDAISYFTDVDPWHVSLRPGESTATQGRAVRPDLTLRCSFADWGRHDRRPHRSAQAHALPPPAAEGAPAHPARAAEGARLMP